MRHRPAGGRRGGRPGDGGPDAGDRAAAGHRLGRGIHARPRGAAAGLVPRAGRSRPASRPPGGRPAEELVQPDQTPPPPPPRADRHPRRSCSSTAEVLAWFWPFAREEPHGHPPFYALLGLAGDVAGPVLAGPAAGPPGPDPAVQPDGRGHLRASSTRRWGCRPAALAAGLWVLQPNLFGHGHYATYDAVLASLWVLAILAFAQAVDPRGTRSDSRRRRDGPGRSCSGSSSAAPRRPS